MDFTEVNPEAIVFIAAYYWDSDFDENDTWTSAAKQFNLDDATIQKIIDYCQSVINKFHAPE